MAIRYLKADEVKRLLEAAASNRDRAILRLLVRTGMRSGECAALKVGDFDPVAKTVRIERSAVVTSYVVNRKTGALKYRSLGTATIPSYTMDRRTGLMKLKATQIPKYKKNRTIGLVQADGSVRQVLPDDLGAAVADQYEFIKIGTKAHDQLGRVVPLVDSEAWALIMQEIRGRGPEEWAWRAGAHHGTLGQRLTLSGIRFMYQRAAKRAGLPKELQHPHVLRHTFSVHFLKAGGDLRSLQRIGGWANLNMVQVYTQFVTEDLVEIAARVGAKVGY